MKLFIVRGGKSLVFLSLSVILSWGHLGKVVKILVIVGALFLALSLKGVFEKGGREEELLRLRSELEKEEAFLAKLSVVRAEKFLSYGEAVFRLEKILRRRGMDWKINSIQVRSVELEGEKFKTLVVNVSGRVLLSELVDLVRELQEELKWFKVDKVSFDLDKVQIQGMMVIK